jgi:hypothetical protein
MDRQDQARYIPFLGEKRGRGNSTTPSLTMSLSLQQTNASLLPVFEQIKKEKISDLMTGHRIQLEENGAG